MSSASELVRAIIQSKASNNEIADLSDHGKDLKRIFVLNPLMGSMLLAVLDVRCRSHIHLVDDMYSMAFTPRVFQHVGGACHEFEISLFDGNTCFFRRLAYGRLQRHFSKVQAATR